MYSDPGPFFFSWGPIFLELKGHTTQLMIFDEILIRLDFDKLHNIAKVLQVLFVGKNKIMGEKLVWKLLVLGDPEVTANIYCKSRNLPNTDTQNYSTDLR